MNDETIKVREETRSRRRGEEAKNEKERRTRRISV